MQRHLIPELMDDPALDDRRHRRALQGLHRINRVSGVERTIWPYLRTLFDRGATSLSMLDIASGDGAIPIRLAGRAKACGRRLELVGCDVSPLARRVALERAAAAEVAMRYESLDVTEGGLGGLGPFDVVLCNLFLHHLDENAVVGVLRDASRIATRLLIVNDLRRDRTNLLLARIVPRILTRSDVVHVDAVRSVRAAFSSEELRSLASEAGLDRARVRHVFPRRMVLTWSPS